LRHVEIKGQVEKENLRDLTYEQLERKSIGLQQSVPDYLAKRLPEPALPSDLESAKKERTNAEAIQQKANKEWETARESLDAARTVRDDLSAKHQAVRVQLDMLGKTLHHARENLDRARKAVPDEMLDANLAGATRTVSSEQSNVWSAEASLKAKNPERVKALAETAKGSLQTTQNRRSAAQTEMTEVQTRLKIHGEEGLHEKMHTTRSRHERFRRKPLLYSGVRLPPRFSSNHA